MFRALLTLEPFSINEATVVTGVITLKSLCPVSLWFNKKLSNKTWESKSVPPIETKFPSVYLKVNAPLLSEVVLFSFASRAKLLFSSIKISAPEI